MSHPTAPMTDAELDAAVARYLGWRAQQVHGAPDVATVVRRLADAPPSAQQRARRIAVLGLAGLLVIVAVGAVSLAGRPSTTTGPLAGTTLTFTWLDGWHAFEPTTGEMTRGEPCDGLCPTGTSFVPSSDGRTVFYIETTPMGVDMRPEPPGWSLWRWDRGASTVSQLVACTDRCMIEWPVPSPDGRSIAYIEVPSRDIEMPRARDAIVTAVVADARTGLSRWRRQTPKATVPTWDDQGRLLLTLLPRPSDMDTKALRVDLETGTTEAVGTDLPDNPLISSPDGQRAVIIQIFFEVRGAIYLVDPDLKGARLMFEMVAPSMASSFAWSPDGTKFAAVIRDALTQTTEPHYGDLRIFDLTTGEVETLATVPVYRSILWLPDD